MSRFLKADSACRKRLRCSITYQRSSSIALVGGVSGFGGDLPGFGGQGEDAGEQRGHRQRIAEAELCDSSIAHAQIHARPCLRSASD